MHLLKRQLYTIRARRSKNNSEFMRESGKSMGYFLPVGNRTKASAANRLQVVNKVEATERR